MARRERPRGFGYRVSYSLLLFAGGCTLQDRGPAPWGDYLGQRHPGRRAELFAPGLISTGFHDDFGPAFSKDGSEVYFRIAGKPYAFIACRTRTGRTWGEPRVAPFSGQYPDGGFRLSADDQRLYFSSRRPMDGSGPPGDSNIWFVKRTEDGWSEPMSVGPSVNTADDEFLGCVTKDGTIYFSVRTPNPARHVWYRNYVCRAVHGQYLDRQALEYPFNSKYFQRAPLISRDESYAVVTIEGRGDSIGGEDLYVTFQTEDGSWTEPQNLGPQVNSTSTDRSPSLSPDGKFLLFVSWRYTGEAFSASRRTYSEMTGLRRGPVYAWGADIYWVSTDVIEDLRP